MSSSELAKLLDRVQKAISELRLTVEQEEEFCRRLQYRIARSIKHAYKQDKLNHPDSYK